jgi:hypothetical protein
MIFCKRKMQADGIRHSALTGKQIKKVAVLGGSEVMLKKCNYGCADAF